ncbi:MAG: antibiotic biosynthesis monooxygenase [Flavobacteriales bacterium]|nr:antibiotic biosynthesis monooxygenase [Flavobacteriales bacterium]
MAYWKKQLPNPPYYAVIFISTRSNELEGYAEMDELTLRLATESEGFIGYESIKSGNQGIFISYWENEEAIERWKHHPVHLEAKQKGFTLWYEKFISQVCLVQSSREHLLQGK